MRILVKKLIDAKWGNSEYVLYREGEWQTPLAILTDIDLQRLADAIDEAQDLVPVSPANSHEAADAVARGARKGQSRPRA